MLEVSRRVLVMCVALVLSVSLARGSENTSPAPATTNAACSVTEMQWLTLRLLASHIRCRHPDVVQARADWRRQQALTAQASAADSPIVDVTLSSEAQRTGSLSGVRWGPSLTASYTVFDHGATRAAIATARANEAASEAALLRTELEAVSQALEAMFDALKAEDSLLVLQVNEETLRKSLDAARARQAVGRGTQVDVLQAFSSLKQAELETTRGRSNVALAMITLRQRLALPAGVDIQPRLNLAQWEPALERIPFLVVDADSLSRARQAQALWEAARQQSINTEAQGRSSVSASGTYRHANRALAGSPRNDASVALTWSIPLLDGGSSKAAVRAAVLNEEKQQSVAESTLLDVEVDMEKSLVDWQNASATLVASRIAQEAAEQASEAQMGRYRAGAGTLLDWLQAQRDALQAQRERLDAGYSLMLALVKRLLAHDDQRLFDLDSVLKEAM